MPNEDDERVPDWRTTCPVCKQTAEHILDGRRGCEHCTRDCTLEEVTSLLWKESARLREVKTALNAAIRERGAERLRSDEMRSVLYAVIDAWSDKPIHVTGDGAGRFLEAIEKCEELYDRVG